MADDIELHVRISYLILYWEKLVSCFNLELKCVQYLLKEKPKELL